jgi:siroheme synthase-like protein
MVGEEKLRFMLKSSPNAIITIVATWIGEEVQRLIDKRDIVTPIIIRKVREEDIKRHDIIISATNFKEVNHQVHAWAKANSKIVNVADTPDLCDFYMGSIVTRGDLKVAISTNGKSPTFAKRFRQYLEEILPQDTSKLIENLKLIRDKMVGDFDMKVKKLNTLTQSLIEK